MIDISQIDFSEEMLNTTVIGDAVAYTCNCGRIHAGNTYGHDYIEKVITGVGTVDVTMHMHVSHVTVFKLLDKVFVKECTCKEWLPLLQNIIKERNQLKNLLTEIFDKIKEYEEMDKTLMRLKQE